MPSFFRHRVQGDIGRHPLSTPARRMAISQRYSSSSSSFCPGMNVDDASGRCVPCVGGRATATGTTRQGRSPHILAVINGHVRRCVDGYVFWNGALGFLDFFGQKSPFFWGDLGVPGVVTALLACTDSSWTRGTTCLRSSTVDSSKIN